MMPDEQGSLHPRGRRRLDQLPSGDWTCRRLLQWAFRGVLLLMLAVAAAGEAWAQGVTCPPYQQEELKPLSEIHAQNGVLSTTFVVKEQDQCVPLWDTTKEPAQWDMQLMKLRTYDWLGAPSD